MSSTSRTMVRPRWHLLVAVVAILGLLAAACSSSDDSGDEGGGAATTVAGGDLDQNVPVDAPGVTDTEINYSVLATGTGNPTGQCILECYVTGIEAYFDYVNTEMGGIYGRTLNADEQIDDEFGKNQEKALGIIADDDTFGTFSNAVLPAGWEALNDEGIPVYVWATTPTAMQGLEAVFGEVTVRCLVVGCWERSVPYQLKISGRHKAAVVGYGISQSSKDCAQNESQSIDRSTAQIGADAEAVYVNDDLAFGLPNGAAPEVTAMKNAGANILVTCIVNNDTKTIMQEAERQGLDVVPVLPQGYDDAELTNMGGAFDGGYIRVSVRSFEADLNDAQEKYLEYTEKNGGAISEVTYYGWINAALAYEGLKLAGPEFDRTKVIEATNTLTGFTAAGMTPPMNWTTGHEAPTPDDAAGFNPYECYSIMKIETGKFVLQGDMAKPFTCWPGDTWEWDSDWPQAMSFD